MSVRTLASIFPRQSPSSWIRSSISAEAFAAVTGFFIWTSIEKYESRQRTPRTATAPLRAESIRVLGGQPLPAIELHDLGTDHAPDRLPRKEPVEHVEADVPARGTPRDELAIDVVPEREARAGVVRLQLPAQVTTAPAVLEQPRRQGPRDRRFRDHGRPDRRQL